MKKISNTIAIICFYLLGVTACSSSQGNLSSASGKNTESKLVKYLNQTVAPTLKAVRVNYYSLHSCSSNARGFLMFPVMNLHKPEDGDVKISGVRSIFQSYPNVVVQNIDRKLLKVNIGTSTSQVLRARIKFLKFRKFTLYNPRFVIAAIISTNEVQAAVKKEGIIIPSGILTGLINPPLSNLPHMPGELNNITFDRALSRVAETFNGVVVYTTCKGENGDRVMQVFFHSLKSKNQALSK